MSETLYDMTVSHETYLFRRVSQIISDNAIDSVTRMRELSAIALSDLDRLTRVEQVKFRGQLTLVMNSMWESITEDLSATRELFSGSHHSGLFHRDATTKVVLD